MGKRNISPLMMAFIGTALLAFGAIAFADGGMGNGSRGWGHHGSGWHQKGSAGADGWRNDLSDGEIEKLEAQRKAFLSDTNDLRQELHSKELELRSILVKPEPDQKKALALQKEISKLGSELDQKRINHMIQMKKISPNGGRRYAGGGAGGFGPGGRGGYGQGGGPGNCRR